MNLKFFCCLPVVAVVGLVNSTVASPSLQCDASRYNIGIKIKSPLLPSIVTKPWDDVGFAIQSDWNRPTAESISSEAEVVIQGEGAARDLLSNCDFFTDRFDQIQITGYSSYDQDVVYVTLSLAESSLKATDKYAEAYLSVAPKTNKTGITRLKELIFKLH